MAPCTCGALCSQVDDSDDEVVGTEEGQADYLAPFLPAITGTRDMTAAEAAEVFKRCTQVRGAHVEVLLRSSLPARLAW